MMKKLVILLALLAFAIPAQAELLYNGDFTIEGIDPLNADGWTEWNAGGWVNREMNENGPYGDPCDWHYAIGNAGAISNGAWQSVSVPDDGATYTLSADVGQDAWWKPDGYVKMEFYDAADVQLDFIETWIYATDYDVATPWANHSVTLAAPAGTVRINAVIGSWTGGDGGTTRFDNVSLVPEPMTIGLLGLGGLFLRRRRA